MKKLLFAISFICYFAVSSGVIINSHYCMKRLVSIHLYDSAPDICTRCGMDTHNSDGCCRNEVKVVKLEQDQNKLTVDLPGFPALEQQAIRPSEFLVAAFEQPEILRHFHNHSPPLLSGRDSYIENRVFRI